MKLWAKLFTDRKVQDRLWELEKEILKLKAEAKFRERLLEDYEASHKHMIKLLGSTELS